MNLEFLSLSYFFPVIETEIPYKQFISFIFHAILSNIIKFHATQPHPTQDMTHLLAQYIQAVDLPTHHLVALWVTRSTLSGYHNACVQVNLIVVKCYITMPTSFTSHHLIT